jgi:hypothetical protein
MKIGKINQRDLYKQVYDKVDKRQIWEDLITDNIFQQVYMELSNQVWRQLSDQIRGRVISNIIKEELI